MLAEEMTQFRKYVRHHALRLTPQREKLVEHILSRHDHYTADELYEDLRRKDKSISRATVYRTLALLEEAGFVKKMRLNETRAVYEHVIGHDHHDHLICNQCWRIVEFVDGDIERLQRNVAEKNGFFLEEHSLKLYGVCQGFRDTGKCQFQK